MLIMAIVGGVAYAIYSKLVPSHIKIITPPVPPEIALEFYQDEECTMVCTFVEWNELEQGKTVTRTELFYVKNTGNVNVTVDGDSTLPTRVGTLVLAFKHGPIWQPAVQLSIGQVCEVRGIMTAEADAPLGDTEFDIIVNAY